MPKVPPRHKCAKIWGPWKNFDPFFRYKIARNFLHSWRIFKIQKLFPSEHWTLSHGITTDKALVTWIFGLTTLTLHRRFYQVVYTMVYTFSLLYPLGRSACATLGLDRVRCQQALGQPAQFCAACPNACWHLTPQAETVHAVVIRSKDYPSASPESMSPQISDFSALVFISVHQECICMFACSWCLSSTNAQVNHLTCWLSKC